MLSSDDLSVIGTLEPDLQFFYFPEIHSGIRNHRPTLRNLILEKLPTIVTEENQLKLTDLDIIPGHIVPGLSLSHSPVGSVIAYHPQAAHLGVDIESLPRISQNLIERVTDKSERAICSQPELLFSAKEACWKAINALSNINVISDIKITSWSPHRECCHFFEVSVHNQAILGHGFTFRNDHLCFAIFICKN